MHKLAWILLISGCTAITDFGGYRFSESSDLAVEVPDDLGKPNRDSGLDGGGSDGGGGGDLAVPLCAGGAQCCLAVPCPGGGCCVSGSCFASGTDIQVGMVCVDGQAQACGTPGAFCCGEGICHNQGCCVGGRCFANSTGVDISMCPSNLGTCTSGGCSGITATCGGIGDACCAGGGGAADFCTESGAVCVSGRCEQCAALPGGQFCCPGNWCQPGDCCDNSTSECVGSGTQCNNSQGLCMNSGCDSGGCGVVGQPCCDNGVGCTAPFTRCTLAGNCDVCGGLDQRCCANKVCQEGFVCDSNDKCRRCGNMNQLCCPGRLCATNLSCNQNNLCL